MRTTRRLALTSTFGVLAVAVVAASVAFACSPNATFSSNMTFGPPGSEVLVTGAQFYGDAEHGPVQIRWSSVTGNQLGSQPGPSFSVPVRIPDAQPGTYYIVAVQHRLDDGSVAGKRAVAFTIEAPAPQPTSTSPSPSPEPTASSPSPEPTATSPEPAPTSQSTPTAGSSSATASGSSGAPTTSNTSSSPVASASPTGAPAGSSSAVPAPSAAASTTSGSAPRPEGATQAPVRPSASSATPVQRSQGGPTAAAPPAGLAAPAPAAADLSPSVSADAAATDDASGARSVPSGVGQATERSALSSLIDSESTGRGGPSFAVGLGLLAIGLMAVFASFCVAHVRQRTLLTVRGRRP